MNSTIKITAKIAEELNHSNENVNTKRKPFKKMAKLGESLKKWEKMYVQCIRSMIDSFLAKKTRRGEI
jgi:hypothetical protein